MSKMTLLEITQDVLSDMSSDNVNSIFDTEESEQVANIVRSTYRSLMDGKNWPHLRKLTQLDPYSNNLLPTHMSLPEGTKELLFLNYDCSLLDDVRKNYQEIPYRDPDDFLKLTNAQNNTIAEVLVVKDPSGVELLIRNDAAPSYWTSFDDRTIVFNSYDSTIEDSLQASKTQVHLYIETPWRHEDSFVPDLPAEIFSLLVEESKSRASFRLRQVQDNKAEQVSRNLTRFMSQKAWKAKGGQEYPNYGRNSRKMYRDPTFRRGR